MRRIAGRITVTFHSIRLFPAAALSGYRLRLIRSQTRSSSRLNSIFTSEPNRMSARIWRSALMSRKRPRSRRERWGGLPVCLGAAA